MQARLKLQRLRFGLRGLGTTETLEFFRSFVESKKNELKALVQGPFPVTETERIEARADTMNREVNAAFLDAIREEDLPGRIQEADRIKDSWNLLFMFVSGALSAEVTGTTRQIFFRDKLKFVLTGVGIGFLLSGLISIIKRV